MIGKALILLISIIATRAEGNPNARLLTVEESVGQGFRSVTPERVQLYWGEDGELSRNAPKAKVAEFKMPEFGDTVVFGESVSRNEFGIDDGVFPSPDGKLAAVYRNDLAKVHYSPIIDISAPRSEVNSLAYPMAGESSEVLQLCVINPEGKILNTLDITDFTEERYLTGVTWSPDSKYIFVQVLDRDQHNMRLNMYRSKDGKYIRTILSEHNDAWVEPTDPIYFLKNSYNFIYVTDNRDGYKNLYLCDTLKLINRITKVNSDVRYLDNDGKYVYYLSSEISPIEQHLFKVRVNRNSVGKPTRLSSEKGWHEIDLSPDCTKFIDRYSNFNTPGETIVKSTDSGQVLNKILTSFDPLDEYAQVRCELGSVSSADGKHTNYYRLFYPRNYDPNKKYPLIVYVYGGPHSQLVRNSWLGNVRMWEYLMAQKGYFVYVQDNRGTSNQGADYEKAINRHCGQAEAADQMSGIQDLLARTPAIDRDRIGLHGWSYGGFMALSLNTKNPYFFKVTVAGGPVIDWKWYEVMYTERYMDRPQTNPDGFAESSLMNKAKDINGRVLICQGVQDDTVVWHHSLSFIQECIKEEKRIDYFPYPMESHNMIGRARVHLYDKITDYFETYL